MADDWKPGDLALRVTSVVKSKWAWKPRPGGVYIVKRVSVWRNGTIGLALIEDPEADVHETWNSSRFRKIHPHTPDEQDAETIRLLTGEQVPAWPALKSAPRTIALRWLSTASNAPATSSRNRLGPVGRFTGSNAPKRR